MDYPQYTRSSPNTALTVVAVGVGALLVYALSSRSRREALLAAGNSAVQAGSRLAATSADRLHRLMPDRASELVDGLGSSGRKASARGGAATADVLHELTDRAAEVVQNILSGARDLGSQAKRAARERELAAAAEEAMDDFTPPRRSGSGSRKILAAAGIGAGLYALRHYGVVDRVREKLSSGSTTDASGAIRIERTIVINAPVEQVFDTWSNYENFPRFMSNVESVEALDGERSHWKVKGPAGVSVEWDSVTRMNRPHELSWQSEPGSTVDNQGSVSLTPDGNGTRATVRMSYCPPAGALGHAVASLFGANPEQELDEDLNRMKQFIEGQSPQGGAATSGDPLKPAQGGSGPSAWPVH